MTTDTNTLEYWLNWRFFLCAIWVLTSMVVSAIIIWKFEGSKKSKTEIRDNWRVNTVGTLYKDEAWRTSLKIIHPAWLLAFRVIAFILLLALLIANVILDGSGIFYFYTQWTFSLVTIYFGLASLFSISGCCQYCNDVGGDGVDHVALVAERGTSVPPALEENGNMLNMSKSLDSLEEPHVRKTAGMCSYVFQIIYQICGGSVILTDCVFWFIIYPFLTSDDYKLGFRFPFFRITYFILWTGIYVIFQWIIHACVSMWWPYPFLDLSSPYAPLWYVGVGFMHLPCYGIFALMVRLKHFCLSRLFVDAFSTAR